MASDDAGVRRITAFSPARNGSIDVTVWYPASAGGKQILLGESVFFVGTPAMLDAPVSNGMFPVILLSHGAGLAGSAQALSWIAAPLAKQGYVVAAPTHPGNTGPSRSAAETMKLWLRPADLTATLDALEKDPVLESHLAGREVGALGLSMGGGTALMIAGARLDPKRLASYCDTDALNASLCDWVRKSGVDLHAMDLRPADRAYDDKRVRFAMAIDPAPVDVFDDRTFSTLTIPVEVVNLGKPGQIPVTAQAAEIVKTIPRGTYSTIEAASHFSMFAECKPGAAGIAEEEKISDPLCTDGDGPARTPIHAQLIKMVTDAFNRALKAP